ncbi:MAG TPA: hypothetical protein VEA16_09960 [Vicinamibacterales bacterium]|nr:hypothetical protein [Vicinamibacterales bacterium]
MRRRTQNGAWVLLALGALIITAATTRKAVATRQPRPLLRDYSNRSGFPLGVEASRGAGRDALIPADMRTPAALRPFDAAHGESGL